VVASGASIATRLLDKFILMKLIAEQFIPIEAK
jgi:hypothetical protein